MERCGGHDAAFYVVRDDLLHPLINGNKARKLDAVLPLLSEHSITDLVGLHLQLLAPELLFKYLGGVKSVG